MRKKLPIIILIAIQLAFALSLTAIRPVTEWLIANKGEEFIFEVERVEAEYHDDLGSAFIYTPIKGTTPPYRDDSKYAIIETGKNGLSSVTGFSEKKPKDKLYLKSDYDYFIEESGIYSDSFPRNLFYEMFSDYGGGYVVTDENLNFTVKATIFNHKIELTEILINGMTVEEYINKHK